MTLYLGPIITQNVFFLLLTNNLKKNLIWVDYFRFIFENRLNKPLLRRCHYLGVNGAIYIYHMEKVITTFVLDSITIFI